MKSGLRAFTLIELLVVVAIIALLISILLPSLADAREQSRRAKCLSNLKAIGQSAHSYASSEKKEIIVPIHQNMVSKLGAQGWAKEWWWRTVSPFSFGGRTATIPYPETEGGKRNTTVQDDSEKGRWRAKTRPMNKFMYGSVEDSDSKKMGLFQCPSDKGYPELTDARINDIDDINVEARTFPMYNLVGNSYRINVAGVVTGNITNPDGGYSVAPYGARASLLNDTGKLAMFTEPLFYEMSRYNAARYNEDTALRTKGWHKKIMTDNVTYADGSARSTRVGKNIEFDDQTLFKMNYDADNFEYYAFLRRGSTWRTDNYPSGASMVPMYNAAGKLVTLPPKSFGDPNKWPWWNYQSNLLKTD